MIPIVFVELQTPWKFLLRLMTNAHFSLAGKFKKSKGIGMCSEASLLLERNHSDVEWASGIPWQEQG